MTSGLEDKLAMMTLFMGLMNIVLGFSLYVFQRSSERRLDSHAGRLARIENHVGLTPLFPLDVECPICDAEAHEPCRGGRDAPHAARFDASPAAERARRARGV